MHSRQIQLTKAIAEIQNLYPPDKLITSYKEFLKIRDILPFYQFNPNLFDSLVTLTNNLWDTTERVSRTSLVEAIKRYASKKRPKKDYYSIQQAELHELPKDTIPKIFSILKKSFGNNLKLNSRSVDEIRKILCSMLINTELPDDALAWLCEHANKSERILNRLLRYPKANSIISRWANENFENNDYRIRRPEMLGWVLDQDPSSEVTR